MALSEAVQGAIRPAQVVTWTREDGTAENLTGATLTGKVKNWRTGLTRSITGTLVLTDAANGVFTWTYSAADVGTAGRHDVQITASFASGLTPGRNYKSRWMVREALA